MNCDFSIGLKSAAAVPSYGTGIACAQLVINTALPAAAPRASANPNFLITSSQVKC
jgi:hypothetical protein